MPRRGVVPKRQVLKDPIYKSTIVSRLINNVMLDGKRSVAQKIVYSALEGVSKKLNLHALEVFEKAVENVSPNLEVKARRVGGANYQVPIEVRNDRRITLALRWIVKYSRGRSEKDMVSRLSSEINDAYNKTGATFKKREDTHKMAEANKAFAHYRW
ncbi:MAG: 30S ribosomal protein S7 [Firmicutes bacterium]|nr:30S ribosomal protein S7 [Bacillota bacterium]